MVVFHTSPNTASMPAGVPASTHCRKRCTPCLDSSEFVGRAKRKGLDMEGLITTWVMVPCEHCGGAVRVEFTKELLGDLISKCSAARDQTTVVVTARQDNAE
jgi:hypothetical protein